MSSRNGIIYIQLDVRGSKGQSSEDLYKRLGDIEVEDQVTVIKSVRFLQFFYKYRLGWAQYRFFFPNSEECSTQYFRNSLKTTS